MYRNDPGQISSKPPASGVFNGTQACLEQVKIAVQTTVEGALEAELAEDLTDRIDEKPRRSGFFHRVLDTQYGRISELRVPKLRWGNKEREWLILQRYQRGLSSFLGFALYLYVLGLSFSSQRSPAHRDLLGGLHNL
jgi:transposase-like protein